MEKSTAYATHTYQTINKKLVSEMLLECEFKLWLPVLTLIIEFVSLIIAFIFMLTLG